MLNSEFIKFRTLLSTLILLGATIVVIVGVGALAAWGIGQALQSSGANPQRAAALAAQGDIAASAPSAGISFAQLILGSLAVLIISSEFTTGWPVHVHGRAEEDPGLPCQAPHRYRCGLPGHRTLALPRRTRGGPDLRPVRAHPGRLQRPLLPHPADQQRLRGRRGRDRHGPGRLLRNSAAAS